MPMELQKPIHITLQVDTAQHGAKRYYTHVTCRSRAVVKHKTLGVTGPHHLITDTTKAEKVQPVLLSAIYTVHCAHIQRTGI